MEPGIASAGRDGAERERLLKLRDEQGPANVVMVAQQPREHLAAIWTLTDVTLVLRKAKTFESVIPS